VDREETVRCLADIAHRHPTATGRVREPLLRLLSDPDPHVRAAAIGFIGKAGIVDRVGELIEGLASRNDIVVRAAQNALIALGAAAIDELAAGFRSDDVSYRDLVLQILSSLGAEPTAFIQIYDAEYRRTCTRAVLRASLARESESPGHPLLRYLDERIEEGLNACLCLTGVTTGSERIADLEIKLRSSRDSHQRAILIEAMESLLSAEKRVELVPLYETEDVFERGKIAARRLEIELPSREQAWSDLASDSDELVVRLQAQLPPPWLVAEDPIADTRGVSMQTMQITAHLQRAPAFNRLAMRELVRVADVVDEIQLDSDEILFEAGEEQASLYLLISGEISLSLHGTEIVSVGPGSLIGELASIDGGLSIERARAVEPVVALRLRREPLIELMTDAPAFAVALSQLLAARVRSLQSELGERTAAPHQNGGD
jgi:hypothetical protein